MLKYWPLFSLIQKNEACFSFVGGTQTHPRNRKMSHLLMCLLTSSELLTCALSSATANQVNDLTVEDKIKIHAEKITEPFCSVNAGTRKQK